MRISYNWVTRTVIAALTVIACFPACRNSVQGEFLSASASGYGAQVKVGVANVLSTDLLAITSSQQSSSSGPPSFSRSSGLVNLNLDANVLVLSLANVTGAAQSQTLGTFNTDINQSISRAHGGVTNLSLGIGRVTLPFTNFSNTISINAGVLNSTSTISGQNNAIQMTGTSTFQSLSISVLGTPINLANYGTVVGNTVTFTPNTYIGLNALGLAGAGIHLNEQIKTFDNLGNYSVATNALRVELSGVTLGGGVGLLQGDVVLGQSQTAVFANVSSVPEPGSIMAICAVGVTMLGFKRRKKVFDSTLVS